MSTLPSWARKPNHKKEVVATPRGWMVKETGEYLKIIKDLDQKLMNLLGEAQDTVKAIDEPVVDVIVDVVPETVDEPVVVESTVEPEKPRRGRKPKAKTTEE